MRYGCGSPKPLQIRSNWQLVYQFDMGKLPRKEREEKTTLKTACLELISALHGRAKKCFPMHEVERVNTGLVRKILKPHSQTLRPHQLCAVPSSSSFLPQVISDSIWNADGGNLEKQPDRTSPEFEDFVLICSCMLPWHSFLHAYAWKLVTCCTCMC